MKTKIVLLLLMLSCTYLSKAQYVLNYQTANSYGWIELGNLTLPQQGNNAVIKIYGGSGYNALLSQQGNIEINIRTSNTASVNDSGYGFSAFATSSGRHIFMPQIKIVPNQPGASATEFRIFAYCSSYVGNSFYTVEFSQGSWTPVNTASADPGPAYEVPFENVVNSKTYLMNDVGIGTTDTKGYKLAVAGPMIAESVKVALQGTWPDYVFTPEHKLLPLSQVETFIKENKHLPEIPSAAQVEKDGINLGEMNAKLLKKIEELTLYVIEQNKRADKQDKVIAEQQKEINQLKNNR